MCAFIADALTLSRLFAAVVLVWLGTRGPDTLTIAVVATALAWTTDQLDGWFARRASTPTHLAPADFAIDTVLYAGTLAYLTLAGYAAPALAGAIVGLTVLLSLLYRRKAVVIIGVRVIDLVALVVIFEHRPMLGAILIGWVALLILIYRRRVIERLPRWVAELKELFKVRAV